MKRFCALVLISLFSSAVSAGLVVVDETVDYYTGSDGLPVTGCNSVVDLVISEQHQLASNVQIGVGDTVDLTFNFGPGQTLHFFDQPLAPPDLNPGQFTEEFRVHLLGTVTGSGSYDYGVANATLTLFNQQGVSFTFPDYNGIWGGAQGLSARTYDFLGPGETVSFTGFNLTFDVADLDIDPDTFTEVQIVAYNACMAIPEPTGFAFMMVAMTMLAGARWHKAVASPGHRRRLLRSPVFSPGS